ncbi:MAG: FtsX-like permease family protein [Peptococcaceae bacterium]|nr:FtsX-like permease family protein [Peptococcaceae bacterium]
MNLTLLVFVVLCTMILSGSAASLEDTFNATQHYFELSNVADQYYVTNNIYHDEFEDWLRDCQYVREYEKSVFVQPNKGNVTVNGKELNLGAAYLNFCTADGDHSLMFDDSNNAVRQIAIGEMAMSAERAKKLEMAIGDKIDIRIGNEVKRLELTTLTKDAVYGKEAMTLVRIFVSNQDYAELLSNNPVKMFVWSIMTSDLNNLNIDYNRNSIQASFGSTIKDLYSMFYEEQYSSITFIVIAIIMMLIALVLLQFGIRFAVEEDYREIGVMKAIGIKQSFVRRIFTIKYFAITSGGAFVGFALGIPFSDLLITPLKEIAIMPESQFGSAVIIRMICSLVVVGIIMIHCRRETNRIFRMKVRQAVRISASRERYLRKGIPGLRGLGMKSIFYLAGNDVFSELRNYSTLFVVIVLSMMMIILPSNIASTLRSGTTLVYCGWSKADAYADSPAGLTRLQDKNYHEMRAALTDIEREFADKGIQINADAIIALSPMIYKEDREKRVSSVGLVLVSDKPYSVPFFTGRVPKLSNEIALTDVLLKELGAHLGDTVVLSFGQEEKEYIITGQMQSMGNRSKVILASLDDEPSLQYAYVTMAMVINFVDHNNIPDQIEKAKEVFPQYNITNPEERLRSLLGGTIDLMSTLSFFLLCFVLIILCPVVYLISHTLLIRDKPAIALMRSIGFAKVTIRTWQTLRILIVTVPAILFGVLVSFPVNALVTRITFGLAGANRVPPQYDILQTYFFYSGLTLICVLAVAIIASLGISKVSMRNIGNHE